MKIGPKGLSLIKSFETFVPYVYDDLVPPVHGRYKEWSGEPARGTLTIGYGHTNKAKHPLRISQGLRITEQQALQILDVDLDECEEAVNDLVSVPLTQGEFDALTSFAFNCGIGNLRKLIGPLNRGDYAGTRRNFDLYVSSKGKMLTGLKRRRDAEQALWDDNYGAVFAPAQSEPVLTPKEIDRTDAAADPVDTWLTRVSIAGPTISGLTAGIEWKVAAVVCVTALIAIAVLLIVKKSRA